MTHQSTGNEVTPEGIVHRCSCGWVSRPCFSNMVASVEGQEHRDAAANAGAHPVFVAPPECEGDPGECAFNGACMYACGVRKDDK